MNQKMYEKHLPRYIRAKDTIRARIFEGIYTDRLPPERKIAEELGISYMTVRRAIGELIDDGIMYRTHGTGTFVAKLGTKKEVTGTIMVSLPRTVTGGLSNPYYSEIICGMEKAARQKGFSLLISVGIDDEIRKIHDNGRFMPIKADGLIMPVDVDISEELKLMRRYIPVVFMGDWQEKFDFPSVYANTSKGFRKLTDYLVGLGHRRIAVATLKYGIEHSDKGRMKGYFDSLKANKIKLDRELILDKEETFEGGIEAADHFMSMDEPPTAIIGHNDLVATGILKRLHERGVKVPDEISVVGFDDVAESKHCHPGLTTVHVPKAEMGEKAVEMIISLMNSKGAEDLVLSQEFQTSLVIRGSTGKRK